jgi:DNA modification methylase
VEGANSDNKTAAKKARRITVVIRKISELKLDPRNARVHTRRQIRRLARSIEAFDFNVPVLIDSAGNVIAGHCRILACQLLGWSEVPTICLDHLTEAQARAFKIADNRLTEISVWDDKLLGEQLKELSLLDLEFELETTGFDVGEIDLLIEGLQNVPEDADRADALPDEDSKPQVSRAGDLWILGDHRIVCGSALDNAAYDVVMERSKAAMVFADPPYNVRIDGHAGGLGNIHHREFAMACGEMTEAEFTAFLNTAFSMASHYSTPGSLQFICMDWRHMSELLSAVRGIYAELKNVCVWVKDCAGMGSLYRSQHELVFVYRYGIARHRNNVQLGQYGRNRTNVWHYPSAKTLSRGEEGNLLAAHPTVKAVAMVADAMMDCTARRDIVLDPFLGSGTTVIAAERTGRRCYGIEIDPVYVDVALRRWQAYTRQCARDARSGRLFNEIEEKGRGE